MTHWRRVWQAAVLGAVLVSVGCASSDDPGGPVDDGDGGGAINRGCQDEDGDGYLGLAAGCNKGTDCDDNDASIHPGADEVCGDDRDNDCQRGDDPCEAECVDADGDGWGTGAGCLGPDCDDANAAVNSRADEICGNGIDEDCDGIDNECPTNCTDADRDGFGAAGQNADCAGQGVDCDDADDTINPEARETCNGVDDDCDGEVDECAQAGATCTSTGPDARCVQPLGGNCESNDNCADEAQCDTQVSECRLPAGQSCSSPAECLDGYACTDGVCSGEFCDVTDCSANLGYCDSDEERCVECRYWDDSSSYGDDDCPAGQSCSVEGFCGPIVQIYDSEPAPENSALTNDTVEMSIAMADCWIDKNGASDNDLCALLYVDSEVDDAIEESELDDAFHGGELDFLGGDRYDALDNLWGYGFFNLKRVEWNADPQPDTIYEYCIWYDTANFDEVTIDKCSEYSP